MRCYEPVGSFQIQSCRDYLKTERRVTFVCDLFNDHFSATQTKRAEWRGDKRMINWKGCNSNVNGIIRSVSKGQSRNVDWI